MKNTRNREIDSFQWTSFLAYFFKLYSIVLIIYLVIDLWIPAVYLYLSRYVAEKHVYLQEKSQQVNINNLQGLENPHNLIPIDIIK